MTTPCRATTTRRLLPIAITALAVTAPIAAATNAFAAGTTQTTAQTLHATDDAYTSSAHPATNNGGAAKLVAGKLNGDATVTYLKFKVGALAAGTTLTGAKVTLSRDEHHLPSTVKLSSVANTSWTEGSLTKNNAPAVGAVAGTVTPNTSAATVSFDVSKLVKGPGTYSFAVTSTATDNVARFRSVEYGATGPQLSLTMARAAAVTPSSSPTTGAAPSASPSPSATTTPGSCTVDAKLVPTCGVLWGAAAGGFTTTPRDQALKSWENLTGRTSSIYHTYHTGDEQFPTKAEIAMAGDPAKPRVLMINWKVAAGYTWAQVAAGRADARIDKEAGYLKANFTKKFFLVIHHEPENDVKPTAGSGMTAKDYAAMFRHVVDRLRADRVTNTVNTLTYMSYEKFNNQSWWYDLYPGDNWVDWITLDAYVSADPNGFHHGDFNYLVDRTTKATAFPGYYTWVTQQHPNKPFMVSEWGVFEYSKDPSQKAAIYNKVLAELKAMPNIKGLMYFDAPSPPGGGDTRVNSSAQALAAFKKIAADPIFNVNVG